MPGLNNIYSMRILHRISVAEPVGSIYWVPAFDHMHRRGHSQKTVPAPASARRNFRVRYELAAGLMIRVERLVLDLLPSRLRAWLTHLGADHKLIARGMIVVGIFVFTGKLAGAAKEMAVAWRYGISETVDAYLFVFNLVQWPINILGGGIGVVLVPLALRLRHEAPQDMPRFRGELLGGTLLVGLGLGAGAWLFLPWLVQQPWVGLAPGQAALARQMAEYLAWTLPLSLLAFLFAAWTMAGNRHLNTLLEGAPALAILCAVLLFGGLAPLVWGTLVGFAIEVVLLYLPLVRRGEAEAPIFVFRSAHWPAFFAGFGMMSFTQALMSLITIADQFFAAHLGIGALSTLGYANRILSLILGLGAIAIGRAALPVFSRAHAEGDTNIARTALHWSGVMFGVGLLVGIFGILLAPDVVALLFERGKFTATDTAHVSELLRFALIQIPFYFASMILTYALMSRGLYKVVALIAAANVCMKLVMSLILVPSMGLNGLVLATAGGYLVSCLLAGLILRLEAVRVEA